MKKDQSIKFTKRIDARSSLPTMGRKWTIVIARAIINDPMQTGEKILWLRGMTENRTSVLKGTLMVLYQTPADHLTARELSWRFIINLPWSLLVCKQLYWQLRREIPWRVQNFTENLTLTRVRWLQMPDAGEIRISHSPIERYIFPPSSEQC